MAHAKLSASESKRWINCPGSVAAALAKPKGRSSRFAREGTAAHFLGEHCLSSDGGLLAEKLIGRRIAVWGEDDEACWLEDMPEGESATDVFRVDDEMAEGVQLYLDTCDAIIGNCISEGIPYSLYTEQWFDLTDLHPDLGGTGDFVLAEAFGWIFVVDLKYGKGVTVEVLDNTQLKIYALGALKLHPECEGVRLAIVQPRKSHVRGPVRWTEYSARELKAFEAELVEAARSTERRNAPLSAGDWCTFCPAITDCPEIARVAMEEAGADFDDEPYDLDVGTVVGGDDYREKVARFARWAPVLDAFIKNVLGFEQRELEAGRPIPGRKLVRRRSAGRKWAVDEAEVIRAVKRAGLKKADCYEPPKLLSPAKLEKKGKAVRAIIQDKENALTHSPPGGLTVADEDDERPAVDPTELAAVSDDEFPEDDE